AFLATIRDAFSTAGRVAAGGDLRCPLDLQTVMRDNTSRNESSPRCVCRGPTVASAAPPQHRDRQYDRARHLECGHQGARCSALERVVSHRRRRIREQQLCVYRHATEWWMVAD